MTDDLNHDRIAAERELLVALNQLRATQGLEPLNEFPQPPFCSFCGRSKSEVGALAEGSEGPGEVAYICRECAAEAHRLLLRGGG